LSPSHVSHCSICHSTRRYRSPRWRSCSPEPIGYQPHDMVDRDAFGRRPIGESGFGSLQAA
jgi:hypothetical protein